MKTSVTLGWICFSFLVFGQAQELDHLKPRTPETKPPLNQLPQKPLPQPPPESKAETIIPELKGIVVVDSLDQVVATGVTKVAGVQVRGPRFLQTTAFVGKISSFIGRSLSDAGLKELQRQIILFCRAEDHPVIDVFWPEQEVQEGIIQLAVLEGKLGRIEVQNEGRKWFSDKLVLRQVRLKPGGVIRESRLLEDINWLNRNTYFLEVNPGFRQGRLGETDLELQVKDRFPVRVYGAYADSGTQVLGEDQVIAGFNWGNAFWAGHELDYQFTSDVEFEHLQAHAVSYVAPLPWRHTFTAFGSYSKVNADLTAAGFGGFTQENHNYQASGRYAIPLPQLGVYHHEVSLGFDYKRIENNLEFGAASIFNTPAEIDQFVLGYRGFVRDPYGDTDFGLQGFLSPGDMTADNTDASFSRTRPAAQANYYYLRLNGERLTQLPYRWSWRLRASFQLTSDSLMPSEQLGIGGYDTVRGYDERLVLGDYGWVINNELVTPNLLDYLPRHKWGSLGRETDLRLLAFVDYGATRVNNSAPGDFPSADLVSIGPGLRLSVRRNFALRFDYGFQLTDKELSADNSRGHVRAELSF